MSVAVVIDDRVTNRNILTRLARLLEDDIVVKAFGDPAEALRWCEGNTPDLVVTDFKMPEMDGAEFISRFRRMPLCFDVPVIVVTVYEDRQLRYQALEAGATDFLLSPIDHREFRVRGRNLLTLRKQQQTIKRRAQFLERKLETSDRLHEQALRDSQEMLLQVIDAVPAAISATDSDGRYVFVNSYLATFLGINPDEALGQRPADILGMDWGAAHETQDRAITETGEAPRPFEERVQHRGGAERVLLTTKSPVMDPVTGKVARVVTASLDISERKKSEVALREAKEKAEAASRAKSNFLASMSHDLRTPLNAVIGFSEMIESERLGPVGSPQYREYAGDITTSARHLLSVIDDILDLSNIEMEKVTLAESEVDVRQLVRDTVGVMRGRPDAMGREIRIGPLAGLPGVWADPRMMKQVLVNVISQGLRSVPAGGHVDLDAGISATGDLVIRVTNDGRSMTEAEINAALKGYSDGDVQVANAHSGSGLGLPLAVALAELHGGGIEFSAVAGGGNVVSIILPGDRCRRALGVVG
ncbi:MAG: response regulator [Alphaproteobacteria bacterium]